MFWSDLYNHMLCLRSQDGTRILCSMSTRLGSRPQNPLLSPGVAYYGNINFFGGPSTTAVKASAKLKQLEEENEDAMFVMVSDVWLDSVEVLEKIHTMFSGYSAMPPTCFIFCGNFSSAPYGRNQLQTLKDSFKALADLICEFPSIHNSSRFVFVPGPEDPGPGAVLPRPPLAEHLTEEFRERVPFSVFTTNPCRIQYCSQEMVVIREDLVNKMCRNCVRLPSSSLDIPSHFVKTILSQGHLTPLPLYVCPVYWAYDYALHVYPVPDVIVFADKYDPFNVSNTDCMCINPGSFPKSGFSFKVYYPSNRTVEDRKEMVFIPPGMVLLFSLVIWHIVLELKHDNLGLSTLDTVAPLRLKKIKENSPTPWYNEHTQALKRAAREMERNWKKTKLEIFHSRVEVPCVCNVEAKGPGLAESVQEVKVLLQTFFASDEECTNELLKDLPVLTPEHKELLETELTFEELPLQSWGSLQDGQLA
ncbi:unnamed protein product [Leuciscus chuanchicus]